MKNRLLHLQQRIQQLEALADELIPLIERYYKDDHSIDVDLANKGQQWYRGCRELLAKSELSTLSDFDECYRNSSDDHRDHYYDLEQILTVVRRSDVGLPLEVFMQRFRKARSLVVASEQEINSRDLLQLTQLSFSVVTSEFDTAQQILDDAQTEEVFIRVAGMIGRVAIERHLFTMVDSRSMTIPKNPPNKRHVEVSDVLTEFVKKNIVTAVQRSHLDSLFSVANHCAHPKGMVGQNDVQRLLTEGRLLTSVLS